MLGGLDATVAIIRRCVKPDGYLVISDAYVQDARSANVPSFDQYAKRDETLAQLTSHGDALVSEVFGEVDDDEDDNEGALIAQRATILAQKNPNMSEAFMELSAIQPSENTSIDETLVDVVWVLRKGGD